MSDLRKRFEAEIVSADEVIISGNSIFIENIDEETKNLCFNCDFCQNCDDSNGEECNKCTPCRSCMQFAKNFI